MWIPQVTRLNVGQLGSAISRVPAPELKGAAFLLLFRALNLKKHKQNNIMAMYSRCEETSDHVTPQGRWMQGFKL